MTTRWATVTDTAPLRITFDGPPGEPELPFTPESLIDPLLLEVDDRVRCELSDGRVVILGRRGGTEISLLALAAPTGVVEFTAGAAAPTGWLLCDGSAVSRTTYSDLFAVIGTTYGAGNGTTTFNVPNLKGRVPVGRDSGQAEFDVLGETGGAKTHTLTAAEIPAHTHTVPAMYGPSSMQHQSGNEGKVAQAGSGASGTASPLPVTNSNSGGGGAHNNLQPYLALNPIIKT